MLRTEPPSTDIRPGRPQALWTTTGRPADQPTATTASSRNAAITVFEGAFILARATGEPQRLRSQLGQLRQYVALVFGVPAAT